MLKMFKIDDGERFWYAGESKENVMRNFMIEYGLDEDEIAGATIAEIAPDYSLKVCVDEEFDGRLPAEATFAENGHWYCTAPVADWLIGAKSGDLICSTVY